MIPIAHRGLKPENSMKGFQRSVNLGFKAIECDVHLTKDNVPVVIHDEYIEKNKQIIYIQDCFVKDIVKYKIPTLEEVLYFLNTYGKDVHLYIEIKDIGELNNKKIVKNVLELVQNFNKINECTIISFNTKVIKLAKTICPEITTGIICSIMGCSDFINLVKNSNADTLWMYYELITDNFMKICNDNNIHVVAWTVNKKRDMNHLKKLGVKSIVSDSVKALYIL